MPEFALRVPEHPTRIRRRLDSRLASLATDTPIRAATLVQSAKHCGRSCCHGRQGGPRHTAWHLTCQVKGTSRTGSVPHDLRDDVRSWRAEHQRLKALRAAVHALSIARVQTHARHPKRQRGRP